MFLVCPILNFRNVIVFIICISVCQSYKNMVTEDNKLCSIIAKRRIEIDKKGPNSALLVTQTRLKDHSIDWISNFECKFEVKAPKHNGIFAVIQYLALRRNKTTGECIDYVQFKKQDGSTSRKFCDLFNAEFQMDENFARTPANIGGPIAENSYVDDKGVLDVRIFISKYALTPNEDMDLKIVLTSFRNCHFKQENDVPCNIYYKDVCINSDFINDGIYNCPYYDCVDEGGCHQQAVVKKESLGNKVLIASLSSLLITFVLFICCLWICRIHKILCWAQTFANSRPGQNRQQTERNRQIELGEQTSPRATTVTIPTTSSAPPETEEDKDLPPSYESLFPSR